MGEWIRGGDSNSTLHARAQNCLAWGLRRGLTLIPGGRAFPDGVPGTESEEAVFSRIGCLAPNPGYPQKRWKTSG